MISNFRRYRRYRLELKKLKIKKLLSNRVKVFFNKILNKLIYLLICTYLNIILGFRFSIFFIIFIFTGLLFLKLICCLFSYIFFIRAFSPASLGLTYVDPFIFFDITNSYLINKIDNEDISNTDLTHFFNENKVVNSEFNQKLNDNFIPPSEPNSNHNLLDKSVLIDTDDKEKMVDTKPAPPSLLPTLPLGRGGLEGGGLEENTNLVNNEQSKLENFQSQSPHSLSQMGKSDHALPSEHGSVGSAGSAVRGVTYSHSMDFVHHQNSVSGGREIRAHYEFAWSLLPDGKAYLPSCFENMKLGFYDENGVFFSPPRDYGFWSERLVYRDENDKLIPELNRFIIYSPKKN